MGRILFLNSACVNMVEKFFFFFMIRPESVEDLKKKLHFA